MLSHSGTTETANADDAPPCSRMGCGVPALGRRGTLAERAGPRYVRTVTYIHEHLSAQQPLEATPLAREAFAAAPVVALATLVFLAHVIVNAAGPYGLHRDEFLYLAMGRHLELWRMDFPPAIALLASASRLLGDSVVSIRLLPALAGALLVVLAGLLARTFGGGRWAQLLASGCVAASPLFLRAGSLFQPVVFDQLWWTVGFLALAGLAERERPQGWLLLGLAGGLGLLTKFSILFFGVAVGAALLLTPLRRALAGPWPWVAVALALGIGHPSLTGQVALGWPLRLQMSSLAVAQLDRVTPAAFFGSQLLLGPGTLLAVAGLWSLLAGRLRAYRAVGWTVVGVLGILLALHGKAYYLGPVYPALYGAGAVALAALRHRLARSLRVATTAAVMAFGVLVLPLGLPVVPPEAMARYARKLGVTEAVATNRGVALELPQDYADMLGWEAMVAAVARVYYGLPAADQDEAVLFAANYGEAGALEFFGPRFSLPRPVSAAGSYWQFGPGSRPGRVLVAVGVNVEDLREFFDSVVVVERVSERWVVPEERNVAIVVARRPKRTLQAMWPRLGPHYE